MCASADAHHDGHRSGKTQRAGAGDNQHGDGRQQGIGERRGRAPDRPYSEGEQRGCNDCGHEPAGDHVGEALDGCAGTLCLGDQRDDAGEHGIGAHVLGAHDQCAGGVDRAADEPVTRVLGDGHCLAGHHCFVDCAGARQNDAVRRHGIAGADAEAIAAVDVVDRDLLIGAVSANAERGLGRQVQQCADGAAGLLASTQFEDLAEQHQDDDDAGGLEIDRWVAGKECGDHAVEECRARTERDQREHVEAAVDEGLPPTLEQRRSRPQHDRDGEDKLQPCGTEPAHIECDQRDRGDQREPEAPGHVGQFGVGLGFRAGGQRLQCHATDRAASWADVADLGMHRAGVHGVRLGWFGGLGREVFCRIRSEFLAAAVGAEVVGGAGVVVLVARRRRVDLHAADGIGGLEECLVHGLSNIRCGGMVARCTTEQNARSPRD